MTTTVDLSPIIQWAVGFVATALGIIGSMVLLKLKTKLNLQISQSQQAAFDDALHKSLLYGTAKLTDEIAQKGWDKPDVHSQVVATAMQQAVKAFPDALNAVGLSTDLKDPKNVETLGAALERALPGAVAEAAASPATPTTAPIADPQAQAAPVVNVHVVTEPTANVVVEPPKIITDPAATP